MSTELVTVIISFSGLVLSAVVFVTDQVRRRSGEIFEKLDEVTRTLHHMDVKVARTDERVIALKAQIERKV